jgi:hypothetical protein
LNDPDKGAVAEIGSGGTIPCGRVLSFLRAGKELVDEAPVDNDDTIEEDEEPASVDVDEAAEPASTPPSTRRVYAGPSDPTIKDLYDRYKDGDLILQPGFQRYFIWDHTKSSRLIESVLLDVPLPSSTWRKSKTAESRSSTVNSG